MNLWTILKYEVMNDNPTIECKSKEDAIRFLQLAKEFFQSNTEGAPTIIAYHLSLIDAVQLYLNSKFDLNN